MLLYMGKRVQASVYTVLWREEGSLGTSLYHYPNGLHQCKGALLAPCQNGIFRQKRKTFCVTFLQWCTSPGRVWRVLHLHVQRVLHVHARGLHERAGPGRERHHGRALPEAVRPRHPRPLLLQGQVLRHRHPGRLLLLRPRRPPHGYSWLIVIIRMMIRCFFLFPGHAALSCTMVLLCAYAE